MTSAGAALEGNKSIRGKLPDEIMRRTNLALVASPGRGSVVLEFSPVASTEAEERYPGGELTFEGPKQPLVQRAVEVALGVIDLAAIEDPLAVPANLAELGPRVAAKALELAELAAAGRFDVDMTWDEPGARAGVAEPVRARWPNWWRTCGPSTSTPRTSPYRGAADGE